MANGRVCEKHGQYCPDGVCKWCDERLPEGEGLHVLIPPMSFWGGWQQQASAGDLSFQQAMNSAHRQLAGSGMTDQERAARAALAPITVDESGETD